MRDFPVALDEVTHPIGIRLANLCVGGPACCSSAKRCGTVTMSVLVLEPQGQCGDPREPESSSALRHHTWRGFGERLQVCEPCEQEHALRAISGGQCPQRGDSQGARRVAWRQRGHAPMTLDPGQRMRCPGEVHPADYDHCLFIWRGALAGAQRNRGRLGGPNPFPSIN